MKLIQALAKSLNCSRRQAAKLLDQGLVQVNGQIISSYSFQLDLAQKPQIKVEDKLVHLENLSSKHCFIFHKPAGLEISMKDPAFRKLLAEINISGLKPVGRLDLDSEGLLLLTDDGNFADQLMHPSNKIQKVYEVWVEGLGEQNSELLNKQMAILKIHMSIQQIDQAAQKLRVSLREGQNRQIRRVCAQAGLFVLRILRIGLGTVQLGNLPVNCYKPLSANLIQELQNELSNTCTR
jgi:23S rRNA pseudouridine2605 synthase